MSNNGPCLTAAAVLLAGCASFHEPAAGELPGAPGTLIRGEPVAVSAVLAAPAAVQWPADRFAGQTGTQRLPGTLKPSAPRGGAPPGGFVRIGTCR